MSLTASAGLIYPEQLPEETHDFVNESGKATLMAITRAVFTRSMWTEIFSTAITDFIRIVIIMTCCRDNLLFYKYCVTYGAVFAFGKTRFGTGRGNRLVNNDGMTLCRTFVCHGIRYITTVAFCGFGSVGCAGCVTVGNIVCEAVTEFCVLLCHGVGYIATVTLCGLGAVGCAGCVTVGNVVCEAVTEFSVLVCYGIRHITTVTFCGFGAVGCAGCVTVGNVVREAVTGCRNDIFLNGVAANGAGTDCETVVLTSRCNNFCYFVFVRTLSLNFCFFESAVFTYQLVKSALCAGCFADYCFAEVVLMTENNVCF